MMFFCEGKVEAPEAPAPGYHTHLQAVKAVWIQICLLYGQITPNLSIFDWQISTSNTKHRTFYCKLSPQHLGSCFCYESCKCYPSSLHFVPSLYD